MRCWNASAPLRADADCKAEGQRGRIAAPVPPLRSKPRWLIQTLVALSCVLFAAALAVRMLTPGPARRAEDRELGSGPQVMEPMQFLSRGARLRVAELDLHVRPELQAEWNAVRSQLFALRGCPRTIDWLDGAEGQRCERLLQALRGGNRAEALAGLTLIFQVARASAWTAGLRGDARSAERLGGLLQEWLRTEGIAGTEDPVLSQPTLAAVLLYGRVMRVAWRAPVLGHVEAAQLRARQFLGELCGVTGRRTAIGLALELRFARAMQCFAGQGAAGQDDVLLGFDEECELLFPGLRGGCEDA